MQNRRVAFCVLTLALLFAIGLTASPGVAKAVPGGNSIQIAIDTTKKSQIKAFGSYTTAPNVTLTKVIVWSYPLTGGVMPPATETKEIDANAGSWAAKNGVIITTDVYKRSYAVRADGHFSDGTIHSSGYVIQQVDGDLAPGANLTLVWAGGFPKSDASKKISCSGTYTGNPNAQLQGEIIATPVTGGLRATGTLKMTAATKTWISDPIVQVPTGGVMYSVIAFAPDVGPNQKWYCASYAVTQVAP